VRFKLVKTGRSYADAGESNLNPEDGISVTQITRDTMDFSLKSSLPELIEAEPKTMASLVGDSTSASANEELFNQLIEWAADDPKRWQQLKNTLQKIYAPAWERIDARDILVAWAAAHLALTSARQQLKGLYDLRRPLTGREHIHIRAREADITFWGRLTQRLAGQIPAALSQDTKAAELMAKLCSRGTKNEQ
jgi:hypothetical protein